MARTIEKKVEEAAAPEAAPEAKTNPQITLERIRKWGACADGREWFRTTVPVGGSYADVMEALRKDGRNSDAQWLAARMLDELTKSPAEVAKAIVEDEGRVGAQLIAGISEVQSASSGHYAKNASSGDNATNASSGRGATNASSGHYAKNASSGDNATNVATGQNSVIAAAGRNSTASGEAGTWIALAEYDRDGKCIGFATGCIGVDGLEPRVTYRALGGNLVEAF